jgi:hypothetical protein
MAKQRPWIRDAVRMMESRAYTSAELSEILMRSHRNGPDSRQVTLILKRDKRFRLVCETKASSLLRNSSHTLPVFGLAGASYRMEHPFMASGGNIGE